MLSDQLGRAMGSLRLSVTDRCNMRCSYCMPEADYVWLPRSSILTFEEIQRLVRIFASLGVGKVRLTGGEPLLRHDLPRLVRMLHDVPGLRDLALTTNGMLLPRQAAALKRQPRVQRFQGCVRNMIRSSMPTIRRSCRQIPSLPFGRKERCF